MFAIVYMLLFFSLQTHGDEQFHIGIINHNTQWHFHCPQNHTQIENPPQEYQPLISYRCPLPSLSIDILPVEIELTFVCRLQSRLLWIIIDLYQYYSYPWSIDNHQVNVSLELNRQMPIIQMIRDTNNFTNRFILVTAFYISFESIEFLANTNMEFRVMISNSNQSLSQCQFDIHDWHTWGEFIHRDCNAIESKTLQVQSGQCHFVSSDQIFESTTAPTANRAIPVEIVEETTVSSSIPDFDVILSVVEENPIETTTIPTTRVSLSRFQADNQQLRTVPFYPNSSTTTLLYHHPHSLFDERYRQLAASLAATAKTGTLLKLTLIFSAIVLLLLVLFFVYLVCYHRSQRTLFQQSTSTPI